MTTVVEWGAEGPDPVATAAAIADPQSHPTLPLLREVLQRADLVAAGVSRRAGLSTTELSALEHLMAGPLGPVELARRVGVTAAATTALVDRLEVRGHAARRPHQTDGRRVDVVVTDSGRREVLTQLAPMFHDLAALDASLDEQESAVVQRYLRGVLAAMQRLV